MRPGSAPSQSSAYSTSARTFEGASSPEAAMAARTIHTPIRPSVGSERDRELPGRHPDRGGRVFQVLPVLQVLQVLLQSVIAARLQRRDIRLDVHHPLRWFQGPGTRRPTIARANGGDFGLGAQRLLELLETDDRSRTFRKLLRRAAASPKGTPAAGSEHNRRSRTGRATRRSSRPHPRCRTPAGPRRPRGVRVSRHPVFAKP
jgi:hypothetical protein